MKQKNLKTASRAQKIKLVVEIAVALSIILAMQFAAAQEQEIPYLGYGENYTYMNVNIHYYFGKMSINNITYIENPISPFYYDVSNGGDIYSIKIFDSKKNKQLINTTYFYFYNFILWDDFDETGAINGGQIELNETDFEIDIPYYENATYFELYDTNGMMVSNKSWDWCGASDVNKDGKVNTLDITKVRVNRAPVPGSCNASNHWCNWYDINRDSKVDTIDISLARVNLCAKPGCCSGCYDTCTNYGEKTCKDSNTVQICDDINKNGCFEKSDYETCSNGMVCFYGLCVVQPSAPSSGGVGGGVKTIASSVNINNLGNSASSQINSNEIINLSFDNKQYNISVVSVSSDSATLLLPNNIQSSMRIGETRSIDLNNDGIKDMKVTLKNIERGKVNLELSKLEQKSKANYLTYLIIIALVLGLIILAIIIILWLIKLK